MNKVFLTFGDSRLRKSARRILDQATAMGIYNKIIIANEHDLDRAFLAEFKHHLIKGSRGFGYWCWKPQIILQTLMNMDEGDVLHWQDIGCHLNPKGLPRLDKYFEIVSRNEQGVLAFQYEPLKIPLRYNEKEVSSFIEKAWTKKDVFGHFRILDNDEILTSEQICSTVLLCRKGAKSLRLVEQWLDAYRKDFSLATDSPSELKNFPEFIENRHDQSILSVLCKMHKVQTLSAKEFEGWWSRETQDQPIDWNGSFADFPIHNKRDKDFGFFWTVFIKVRNQVVRALKKLLPASPSLRIGRW